MMAKGQIMCEAITKAVAEATRVAIQAMVEAQVNTWHGRTQDRQSHYETAYIWFGCWGQIQWIKDFQARGK